jgi:hypothetical protein
MRNWILSLFAAAAVCSACDAGAFGDDGVPTDPSTLPHMTGLWRQETSIGNRQVFTKDFCFDSKPVYGTGGPDQVCQKPLVSKLSDGGLKIIVDCKGKNDSGSAKVVTILHGDAAKGYTVDGKIYASFHGEPKSDMGAVRYHFTYLGSCPALTGSPPPK